MSSEFDLLNGKLKKLEDIDGNNSSKGNSNPEDDKWNEAKNLIITTYLNYPRIRPKMLEIETHILNLIRNKDFSPIYIFPHESSFFRMLTHNIAEYYNVQHDVEPNGTQVRITTTPRSSIKPSIYQLCSSNINEIPVKSDSNFTPIKLLKKPQPSSEYSNLSESKPIEPAMSIQERREIYIKARARILDVPVDECKNHFDSDPVITPNLVKTAEKIPDDTVQGPQVDELKLSFIKSIQNAAKRASNSSHTSE